jgi:hydroxyacylglutathione hydrolase
MIREDEDIYLIIEPARIEEAVRDLVRVGLDRIRGWYPAAEISTYAGAGAKLATMREIDVGAAYELVQQKRVNVLDVRRASEFAGGHLPGATNIAHTRLAARMNDVPPQKPLLVNCRSGARSARACALLQRAGLEVMNLNGGILAWDQLHAPAAR